MYEFRPFELTRCEYKSYAKSTSIGRGILYIPKPRSGHRVVANETDLFSFGGKYSFFIDFIYSNFVLLLKYKILWCLFSAGYNPHIDSKLLPELLKFNFLTQKWSIVFSSKSDQMPQESVSNALALKDNCLLVTERKSKCMEQFLNILYSHFLNRSCYLHILVVWRNWFSIRREEIK